MCIRTRLPSSGKLTLIMWLMCLLVSSAQGQTTLDLGETLLGSQKLRRVSRYPAYVKPGERAVVQRSIFQIADDAQLIQLAFVIDGTNSMGRDIEGLKRSLNSFIANVRNRSAGRNSDRKPPVEVAIVIYRDLLSPSGAYQIPSLGNNSRGGFLVVNGSTLKNFTTSELFKTLDGVRTEAGFPYFPEQVDRGIHAALTKLRWDVNHPDVARAIIVAGDAPPWSEDYLDIKLNTKANQLDQIPVPMRGFSTAELTDLANKKKIKIFSILCSSGFAGKKDPTLFKTAKESRPELERFFKRLSDTTGGQYLNTSDHETVQSLKKNFKGKSKRFLELRYVTSEDVEKRKRPPQQRVRVAFLPLLPVSEMTFSDHPAVNKAAGMIVRLQQTEGLDVVKMLSVKRTWKTLQYEEDSENSILSKAARKLGVDFLVGGDFQPQEQGKAEITLRVYDSLGKIVATTDPVSGKGEELDQQCLGNLIEAMSAEGLSGNEKARSFAAILGSKKSLSSLKRSLAKNEKAFELLIQGYQQLEQATEYNADQVEGTSHSEKAKGLLEKALEEDPGNPWILSLLASCEFNLENPTAAKDRLTLAYESRNRLMKDDNLRLEIEADYTLFVENNHGDAIRIYEQMKAKAESDFSRAGLRARWMLSGLYLGDWGSTDSNTKSLFPDTSPMEREEARRDKAEEIILDILAYWPKSAEAAYYAKFLNLVHEKKQKKRDAPTDTDSQIDIKFVEQGRLRIRRDYKYGFSVPQTGRQKIASSLTTP